MKLYYAPGACSLASRIVINELGLDADYVRTDLYAKRTEDGRDFLAINPLGYVPILEVSDGEYLRENGAILPYLASLGGGALAPGGNALERARLDEALAFLSAELHKAIGPLFGRPEGDARQAIVDRLQTRFAAVERQLADGRDYWLGANFTVADALAYVILSWAPNFGLGYADYPAISAYLDRIGKRESVRRAYEAEGLLETA